MADDAVVTISGTLTTALGALETGRTAFVQDSTGGIALYLDAPVVASIPAGAELLLGGAIDTRYGQRTLRISEAEVIVLAQPGLPAATSIATGAATEAAEGRRVVIEGLVIGGSDVLADGLAVSVDDGSGAVRIVVTPAALSDQSLVSGSTVRAAGSLGQRDSTGTGTTGYRLYVTLPSDLEIVPPPEPTPTPTPSPVPTLGPTPTPTASASATPGPTSTPTASATPTPSPSPAWSTIAGVRGAPIGTIVTVRGVVTAEAGRLGTPALLAIADATGGIIVKLPDTTSAPARGRILTVRGPLADPYGQLELRPAAGDVVVEGTGSLPVPQDLASAGPNESTEARLVRSTGTVVVKPSKSTSGDITFQLEFDGGTRIKVMADASSGVTAGSIRLDARYRITGVAGQRATRKGALDGYRVWLRDPADLVLVAGPSPSASPSPSAGPTPKPTSKPSPKPTDGVPSVVSVAAALRSSDRDVAIDAVVTAAATLLDASGRRIVVEDATAAIEILLPKDTPAPGVGVRVRVVGRVGTAYGAPRLRATMLESLGARATPAPMRVHGALTKAHTWRLVAVAGRVDSVRKLGERWRAEVVVGTQRVIVVGQPGARIPIDSIVEGRAIEVTGIVRPAYPSASDKRASLLPRSIADVRVAGGVAASGAGDSGPAGTTAGSDRATGNGIGSGGSSGTAVAAAAQSIPDADLADLEAAIGTTVRVGGLVVELDGTGFSLDDGTAVGRVVLTEAALEWLPLIEPGDAINVTGQVERVEGGAVAVVVHDPAAIAVGADLAALADPSAAAATTPVDASAGPGGDPNTAGLGDDLAGVPGAGAGVLSLGLISLASLAVTLLRRRHTRRLLAGRVAQRLAAFGAVGAPPPG